MKQLLVAESAGFCFGVRRSVEMAESVLARFGSCLSYGELIHNDDVVSALQEKGMRVIASPSEAGSGDRVIIRAHGVSRSVIDSLEAAGAEVVDASSAGLRKKGSMFWSSECAIIPKWRQSAVGAVLVP